MFSEIRTRVKKAGHPPGTALYTGDKKNIQTKISVVQYSPEHAVEKTGTNLSECLQALPQTGTTWVNIEGLSNTQVIEDIAKQFNLHPLTIEDILNVQQRPKVEEFENYIFVTLKVLEWHKSSATFSVNQLSLVVGKQFLLCFQEIDTALFDVIRTRLQATANQRLRQQNSDYLAYRLIDIVVDEYFVVLEALGDKIERAEQRVVSSPKQENARNIYRLKRQMLLLRKAIWPMREAISHLLYVEDEIISKFTRTYLRDVYDHTMQAIDTVETFRDMLTSMLDMYLSGLTIRMNEIMKTLTIITTIFIPITAIASIYGMNLPDIPLMKSAWGFTFVAISMFLVAIGMMLYFRKKKWV